MEFKIMTTINILNDDFEILFEDEKVGSNAVAGLKTVRRKVGASETVYTTNALYSAIADAADEFIAMGFENPMLPVTPNAYTMENYYFIPKSSTEYLEEGAISAAWGVTSGQGIYRKVYTTVTAAAVFGDIGRQVTEATSGDTGTLIDFEIEPDGTTVLWIRPDAVGDIFALSTALTCTGDAGTMSVTGAGAATSGRTLFSSIQVIGSVPTATEVYLYQDRQKMTSSTGAFQWWDTNTNVSLGIIDILIRVQSAGGSIADGDVEVFSRRYTSLYDNFRLNVAAGGRSALPLASATDINNTTGYLAFTGSSGAGTFNIGSGIYVGASWTAATKKGVVTAVGGTTGAPELEYYLVGDLSPFVNTDAIKEYVFSELGDGDATCTAGTPAANLTGPTDATAGEGGTVTVTIGHTVADHDGDNSIEPYSITVDAQGDVVTSKVYERIKYITRRGAAETDLFGAGVNIPGEAFRGIEAIYQYDAASATDLTEGDNIDNDNGVLADWTARLLADNTLGAGVPSAFTYITVTDQQTSLKSVIDNDLIYDEASESVTLHEAGTVGFQSITSPKSSPFGTFTGTQIFGARGVLYTNVAAADAQNYILTDDLGNLRSPPNTITFAVNNTAAGDRVFVARDNGTAGIINKDQYGGLAVPAAGYNQLGDSIIRVAGNVDSIGNDTPASGYIRVVHTTLLQEHHYVYDSLTLSANDEFNLRVITSGTVTTGGTPTLGVTTLVDTGSTFETDIVEVGMLVRSTFAGKTTHVWEVDSVDSETQLTVHQLYGPLGATQDWDIGDTFEINRLIGDHTSPGDYTSADDVYTPILDIEATSGSTVNSFVKTLTSNFGVVVNVRQGKIILPFSQNVTQQDGNTNVTVVRTPDTIAT
jgi:hypothetical protein